MTGKPMTDAEEARVQRMIASDLDNPEWTEEDFARAKPFAEVFPALAEKMRRNIGGRPKSDDPKIPVSLRLDRAVVARFKKDGPGWQSRMNEALRKAAGL